MACLLQFLSGHEADMFLPGRTSVECRSWQAARSAHHVCTCARARGTDRACRLVAHVDPQHGTPRPVQPVSHVTSVPSSVRSSRGQTASTEATSPPARAMWTPSERPTCHHASNLRRRPGVKSRWSALMSWGQVPTHTILQLPAPCPFLRPASSRCNSASWKRGRGQQSSPLDRSVTRQIRHTWVQP